MWDSVIRIDGNLWIKSWNFVIFCHLTFIEWSVVNSNELKTICSLNLRTNGYGTFRVADSTDCVEIATSRQVMTHKHAKMIKVRRRNYTEVALTVVPVNNLDNVNWNIIEIQSVINEARQLRSWHDIYDFLIGMKWTDRLNPNDN